MKHFIALLVLVTIAFVLSSCLASAVDGPPSPLSPLSTPTPADRATVARPEVAAVQPQATPSPGPVTITYWEEEDDDGAMVLDELAAAFMKETPDIKVVRAPFKTEELREQFRVAVLNGKSPEVVRGPGELAGPFGSLEIVRPLDGIIPQALRDQFFPGALAAAQGQGRLWGLPDNYGDHLMLLYNRDLVAEVPSNTDAWISQLKTLTDASREQYGLAYDLKDPFWLMPWLGGFGGWPVDDTDRLTLNTQSMVDALQFLQDLKLIHRVVPTEATYATAYDLFKGGKAAYVIDGAWNLGRYRGVEINLGIAVLPRVSKTGLYPTPMTLGKYWFISKEAKGANLDAALRFVEFMTSAEAQETWLAKAGRLPSNQEAARSQLITQDPILSGSVGQLSKGHGLRAVPEMFCAWHAMRDPLAKVMDGAMTSSDAAQAMQAEAESCVNPAEGADLPADGS